MRDRRGARARGGGAGGAGVKKNRATMNRLGGGGVRGIVAVGSNGGTSGCASSLMTCSAVPVARWLSEFTMVTTELNVAMAAFCTSCVAEGPYDAIVPRTGMA